MSSSPPARHGAPPRHPTISDVAAAAQVSASTVSRALRNSPLINDATRSTVLAAAEELGYTPSAVARSFRAQSSPFVGVVVPEAVSDLFGRSVQGAHDVLEPAGYQLLLMSSSRQPEREAAALETLVAHRVAGILLSTSGGYVRSSVPVVFFDQVPDTRGLGLAEIEVDNARGIELLVSHLVERHGHTRIGYLGGQMDSTAVARRDAFRRTLAQTGISVPEAYVQTCDAAWSEASAMEATERLLALDAPPSAIVAASEALMLGALRVLREAGRRVPDDAALVCFDDPHGSDLLAPPLTAVSQHPYEMGQRAAQALLDHLSGEVPEGTQVRLAPELVVRRSCGCGATASE